MPKTELFDQRGMVAEQVCSSLRTHERCDRVGLTGKNKPKSNHGEMAVSDARCFQ